MELALYIPTALLGTASDLSWLTHLDSVYIGEIFCERRGSLDPLLSGAREIRAKGKKVYISTPVLPTDENALRRIHYLFELTERGVFDAVCVNDAGALKTGLEEFPSVTLYAGPYLGIRNYRSAKVLEELGVKRIVAPHDLPMREVSLLAKNTKVEIEIFVHGSIPLLTSKRCLLLRARGIEEEKPCNLLCRTLKEGIPVATLDGSEPFLILGGRTAYAYKTYCLIEHISLVKSSGCSAVRIEEWNRLHPETYRKYKKVLSGERIENLDAIKRCAPNGLCNGWFFGKEGCLYE